MTEQLSRAILKEAKQDARHLNAFAAACDGDSVTTWITKIFATPGAQSRTVAQLELALKHQAEDQAEDLRAHEQRQASIEIAQKQEAEAQGQEKDGAAEGVATLTKTERMDRRGFAW